jgi:hypothetical protein
MAVTETSRRAYYAVVLEGEDLESRKDIIMAFMLAAKRPVTRRDISEYTEIPMHIVSARVKGLIGTDKDNPDYIWVHHIGRCKYNTQKKIEVEYLVPMIEAFKERRQFDWSQATLI